MVARAPNALYGSYTTTRMADEEPVHVNVDGGGGNGEGTREDGDGGETDGDGGGGDGGGGCGDGGGGAIAGSAPHCAYSGAAVSHCAAIVLQPSDDVSNAKCTNSVANLSVAATTHAPAEARARHVDPARSADACVTQAPEHALAAWSPKSVPVSVTAPGAVLDALPRSA
jgi:hypothetical protein